MATQIKFTPPQSRLIEHMVMTGQAINRDVSGCWYLSDGLRPHPRTVKSLIERAALVEDQTDLLGDTVTAYRLNVEIN